MDKPSLPLSMLSAEELADFFREFRSHRTPQQCNARPTEIYVPERVLSLTHIDTVQPRADAHVVVSGPYRRRNVVGTRPRANIKRTP